MHGKLSCCRATNAVSSALILPEPKTLLASLQAWNGIDREMINLLLQQGLDLEAIRLFLERRYNSGNLLGRQASAFRASNAGLILPARPSLLVPGWRPIPHEYPLQSAHTNLEKVEIVDEALTSDTIKLIYKAPSELKHRKWQQLRMFGGAASAAVAAMLLLAVDAPWQNGHLVVANDFPPWTPALPTTSPVISRLDWTMPRVYNFGAAPSHPLAAFIEAKTEAANHSLSRTMPNKVSSAQVATPVEFKPAPVPPPTTTAASEFFSKAARGRLVAPSTPSPKQAIEPRSPVRRTAQVKHHLGNRQRHGSLASLALPGVLKPE